MDLHQKVVIITGASEGIGAAIACELVKSGSNLVLCARNQKALSAISEQTGIHNTIAVPADVSSSADIKHLVQMAIDHFGRIDIVINNAGIGYISPIEHIDITDFTRLLSVNLFGPINMMQQVIPVLRRQGGGLIINVSSMITRIATENSGGYRASKMALDGITDAARLELKKDNIRVMSVYPGLTSTNFFKHSIGQKSGAHTTPGGECPEAVAKRIVSAIQREPRALYMGFGAALRGSFAQLFPSFAEQLTQYKKKIRHFLTFNTVVKQSIQ